MGEQPRWPTQQAVFGAGVIVLILAAMGEVVLLPPGKFYERLVVFAVITGFLAARISSVPVCVAVAAFGVVEFLWCLSADAPAGDGGRWPSVIPIAMAATIGRGYRTLRLREAEGQ